MADRLRWKTRFFVALVVVSSLLGNLSLSFGLRQLGRLVSLSPLVYLRAFFNPWVSLGIALLAVWLFAHITILSWADLSYVLPVTAVGYVLVAVAGKVLLQEQISGKRWVGIALIMLGVMLVGGGTAPQSPRPKTGSAGASR